MEFDFDPAKNAANIEKHGFSLGRAAELDFRTLAIAEDDRKDYSEQRLRGFGYLDGEAICVVFTRRAGIVRVISLRRAHKKEMKRYGK